jgi:hypothetical protein
VPAGAARQGWRCGPGPAFGVLVAGREGLGMPFAPNCPMLLVLDDFCRLAGGLRSSQPTSGRGGDYLPGGGVLDVPHTSTV